MIRGFPRWVSKKNNYSSFHKSVDTIITQQKGAIPNEQKESAYNLISLYQIIGN